MKCLSCKNGTPEPGTTTFTADADGVLVIVRNVPALICNICGEEYFDAEVSAQLQDQIDEAAKSGGELTVRTYRAA
jgi:YgiT-type zinc finger domain-containing protein